MPDKFSRLRLERLQRRLEALMADYEVAMSQQAETIDDSSRVRFQRKISYLHSEIEALENEIETLHTQSDVATKSAAIPTSDDVFNRILALQRDTRRDISPETRGQTVKKLVQAIRNRLYHFALFFAISNNDLERRRISRQVAERIEEEQFVEIDLDPENGILEQLFSAPGRTNPLIVYGIENLLPSSETRKGLRQRTLQELQLQREQYKKLNRPILIWMPEYVYTLIGQQAVDFWSWQSESFSFLDRPQEYLSEVSESFITNLDQPNPNFIGREREIVQVTNFLKEGLNVIIVGLGGSGKTEIALRIAEELRRDFPDGQLLIKFGSDISIPTSINQALRNVIQLISPGMDVSEERTVLVATYRKLLRNKRFLFILDDVSNEDEVEPFLISQKSQFLITSRNVIKIPNTKAVFIDTLSIEESISLLQNFIPNIDLLAGEKLSAILGYLPLAIQVVGGYLRSNPRIDVNRFLKQLEIEIVTATSGFQDFRGAESLQTALTYSYNSLPSGARDVLKSLSVFVAPFDAQAEESVGKDANNHHLAKLMDYELVSFSDRTQHYQLHPYVSQFADKQLSDDEKSNARKRHAIYYLEILKDANQQIEKHIGSSTTVQRGLKRIETEWANIQSGQKWAADNFQQNDEIARLCIDYARAGMYFIDNTCTPELRLLWYQSAFEASKYLHNLREIFSQVTNIGRTYWTLGDWDKSISFLQQALQISKQLEDVQLQATTVRNLARIYFARGQISDALNFHAESSELSEEIGDIQGKSTSLQNMAQIYLMQGKLDRALPLFQESLQLKEQIGDIQGKSSTLHSMAQIYYTRGELDRALNLYKESLRLDEQIGDVKGKSTSLQNMAEVYSTRGELDRALSLFQESLQLKEQIGDIQGKSSTLHSIAQVYTKRGDLDRALDFYHESLQLDEKLGNIQGKSMTLQNIAQVYAKRGELARALSLYKESLWLDEQIGDLRGKALILANIADIFLMQHNFNEAEQFLNEALLINQRLGYTRGMAFNTVKLGQVAKARNDTEVALARYREGLSLFQRLGLPEAKEVSRMITLLEE